MDLNQYGGACRCLLRLLEDQGNPGTSDSAFIARFLSHYPEWYEKPGLADVYVICQLARELGLMDRAEIFRDYERVLAEHSAGRNILIFTERPPEQMDALPPQSYVTVLVNMSSTAFALWCPYPSGQSDTLPKVRRIWWDRWFGTAMVLYGRPHSRPEG